MDEIDFLISDGQSHGETVRKKIGRKPKEATGATAELQTVTILASVLNIDKNMMSRIKAATENVEYSVYAMLCIYDGCNPEDVVKVIETGGDVPARLSRLRQLAISGTERIVADEQIKPETRKEPEAETAVSIMCPDGEISLSPPRKENVSHIRRIFARTRKEVSKEERFKMYADLLADDMTEKQQEEIITAINAGLPYDVVSVIAKKKYSPEIIKYLAATYLKMTREGGKDNE